MSDSSKKQNFLHGAALLALATAVVKIIGALYKIPLKMIIGDIGFSYFSVSYQIYSVLLMVCTAGLPIAMSRMISRANTLANYGQVRQVYRVSYRIFLWLGVGGTALMCLLCKPLANAMGYPDAWFAILCLGPCALLMCLLAAYRGYFQGQENMRPTSNSQMLEAFIKLIVGLAAALALISVTGLESFAAGGAILGVTVSCLVSVIYLRRKFRADYRQLPNTGSAEGSMGSTAKQLLAIAIPITIGSAGLYLLTAVETGVYTNRLVDLIESNQYTLPLAASLKEQLLAEGVAAADLSGKVAASLNGIYSFGQTIFNMPCAFIVPITISIIPAITAKLTRQEDRKVRQIEESAARITGLLSLPCSVGLALLASPIMSLLGGYGDERNPFAAQVMIYLGASVCLYAIIQYTNALLQAHGYAHVPVITMLSCGVVKLAVVYILAGNPHIGIMAAPIATILCYAAISVLNLLCIRKLIPQKPKLLSNLLRSLPSAVIMGAAVFGTYYALTEFMHLSIRSTLHSAILCAVPIGVGVIVYLISASVTRAITRDDCELLPKGDKIAKLLHLH